MGNTHELLTNNLYECLRRFGSFDSVGKHTEYPLEDRINRTDGETDVHAIDLEANKLYIFEVKSSPNYLNKARKQLRRARKYYSQFDMQIETFIYYKCANSIYIESVQ